MSIQQRVRDELNHLDFTEQEREEALTKSLRVSQKLTQTRKIGNYGRTKTEIELQMVEKDLIVEERRRENLNVKISLLEGLVERHLNNQSEKAQKLEIQKQNLIKRMSGLHADNAQKR